MYDVDECLKFMKVSKQFKNIVKLLHKDIYNVSLGFCTKLFWLRKTWPLFNAMVVNIEIHMQKIFPKKDIRRVFCQFSLFEYYCTFSRVNETVARLKNTASCVLV